MRSDGRACSVRLQCILSASPNQKVGKTLIARLLIDFLLTQAAVRWRAMICNRATRRWRSVFLDLVSPVDIGDTQRPDAGFRPIAGGQHDHED